MPHSDGNSHFPLPPWCCCCTSLFCWDKVCNPFRKLNWRPYFAPHESRDLVNWCSDSRQRSSNPCSFLARIPAMKDMSYFEWRINRGEEEKRCWWEEKAKSCSAGKKLCPIFCCGNQQRNSRRRYQIPKTELFLLLWMGGGRRFLSSSRVAQQSRRKSPKCKRRIGKRGNSEGNHGFHCKLYFIRDLPSPTDVPDLLVLMVSLHLRRW